MASRKGTECPPWRPRAKSTSEIQLHICGSHFAMDQDLLVLKSAKIAKLLQINPPGDLSLLLRDIPGDQESMELVGRFCHGFEINLLPENVVRVVCVAHYLGMTDNHSPDNLLSKGLLFYEQHVIPSWSNCIKALKNSVNVLQQAIKLGLIDPSVDCIIKKVQEDPRLLGEPLRNPTSDDEVDENIICYKPNPRRKLFDPCWKSEDLTSLPLLLYEPIMAAIIQQQVPQEYVAANLCKYAKRWIFSRGKLQDDTPLHVMNSLKEIVESLVSMLPHERDVVPCSFLFRFLRHAIALDANAECKNALEVRIGKQLDQASVNDLLIPSHGYANDQQYDTECVRRILKHYYCNYHSQDPGGLISVAELIDEFLGVISADRYMKISTFLAFADMSVSASNGTQRNMDGVYRAVDIYLDKHKHLTESEREELCRILDCNKMSAEACEHAAQNERLPVRVVVQVLFVTQLKLREAVTREVVESEGRLLKEDGDVTRIGCNEEEVRSEMDKMGSKVLELEKECSVIRREFESGGAKRQKTSMWKEMKRKFGCGTSMHDSNCHVKKKKKVHPR